jgi:hypothetical protein
MDNQDLNNIVTGSGSNGSGNFILNDNDDEIIGVSQTTISTKESSYTDCISGITNPFPAVSTPKKPTTIAVPRSSTKIKNQNLGIIGDLQSPPCLATRSKITSEGNTVANRTSVAALASQRKRKKGNSTANAVELLKKKKIVNLQ